MRKIVFVIIVIVLLLINYGCFDDNCIDIEKINREPVKFEGKEISVRGYVTFVADIPFTSKDYFKVYDNTGEIWILTAMWAPPKGVKVRSQGILKHIGRIPIVKIDLGYCIQAQDVKTLD